MAGRDAKVVEPLEQHLAAQGVPVEGHAPARGSRPLTALEIDREARAGLWGSFGEAVEGLTRKRNREHAALKTVAEEDFAEAGRDDHAESEPLDHRDRRLARAFAAEVLAWE